MNTPDQQSQPVAPAWPDANLVLQIDRRTAAKMLNYSPATFDRLVKRGLIRANRATGRPRFSIAELQRFVDECSRSLGLAGENGRGVAC